MTRETPKPSLNLMAALAVRGAFEAAILPEYEAETGTHVAPSWTPTTVIMSKIAAGERADVVVVIVDSMDRLIAQGLVDPTTRVELAHSRLGLAVPAGAPHPDISTLENFTKALLNARSVAYSKGGASGIYFQQLIAKLGITDAINARATTIPQGFTAEQLVNGKADMAVQQVSELMVVPTVEVIGKFPEEVQQITSFSAAMMTGCAHPQAAKRLLAAMTGPRADAAYIASGVDPITS